MVGAFLMGLAVGAGLAWFLWWSIRREIARLEEEKQLLQQEKKIVLDFMHHMVEAIGEGISRDELFKRVVHAAILSTGALSAALFERDCDRLRGVAVEGLFPLSKPLPDRGKPRAGTRTQFVEHVLRSEVINVGEGLVGSIARSGQGVLIEDARHDPRIVRHEDPALAVRSFIGVPVSFRDRNLAVLAIVNPADGESFGETDFSLAKSLAEQAGLAIHNLDLMALQIEKNRLDVDLSLAREIQGMLLPKQFPKSDLLDVAAVYQPAQKVGGDLYDVFSLGENRYGFAVADVSGKGVPASLVMAICQSNLRHLSSNHQSPSKVLRELNRFMVMDMRRDMFVTMTYAVIDTDAGTVTLARAGHELPILVTEGPGGGATTQFLRSEGMALGMVPDAIFGSAVADLQLPFRSGDVLLLYTDGLTEAVNLEGVEYSNTRLAEGVRSLRGQSAAEINHAVVDQVARFLGGERPGDDITMLTIRHR